MTCLVKHREHRIGMMDRQDGIEDICRVDPHVRLGEVVIGDEVIMGEHDALRGTGGTGGEEDRRCLRAIRPLRLHVRSVHIKDEGIGGAGLQRVLRDPKRAVLVDGIDALCINEEPGDAPKGHKMLHLAILEKVIEGNHYSTGVDDAEVRDRPFGAVLS